MAAPDHKKKDKTKPAPCTQCGGSGWVTPTSPVYLLSGVGSVRCNKCNVDEEKPRPT